MRNSVLLFGCMGVLFLCLALVAPFSRERIITLETTHREILAPHEHGDEDAVSDNGHHIEMFSPETVVERLFSVTSLSFEILNASSTIVHHAALLAYRCNNDSCTEYTSREIVRYGQDTMYLATSSIPDGYMIPLYPGERLRLELTAHNPEEPLGPGTTYRDVYARMTLHEHSRRARHALPVRFVHLFVQDTCTEYKDTSAIDSFTVPPQMKEYRFSGCPGDNSTLIFAEPGVIVHMGAHLHGWQGGKEVTVLKNGEPLYTFTTAPSADDRFRYDTEYVRDVIRVNKGDQLSLSVLYENLHQTPIRGAMGMSGFYIADSNAYVF